MAVYTVTNRYRVDDFAVVQLLTEADLVVGGTIVVAGVEASFNATTTVRALPQYLFIGVDDQGDLLFNDQVPIANQVLYAAVGDNVERIASTGTVTYTPSCTWIAAGDVSAWLNIPVVSANDTALITQAAAASSQFMFRRRQESGYVDSLTTVPSADVRLATVMYAGAIYRMRGSLGEAFASFDQMGNYAMPGLTAPIKQLAGIDRPAIA
jgi:hypothetical protein